MIKYVQISVACMFLCLVSFVSAQSVQSDMSDMLDTTNGADVELNIQLYNQQIYFSNDSVLVRIRIHNNSPNVYRFRLADNPLHNVDFDMRGVDNQSVPPSEDFIQTETSFQRVFYRSVELLPGEEFSFIENLQDYREIPSGIYILGARFFPELRGIEEQTILSSNNVTLSVREGFRRAEQVSLQIEEVRQNAMQIASLPPDEVISYTLNARMRSENEKFLQYLDIESLYTAQPNRRDEYTRLSALGRREALNEYENELISSQTGEGISLIPSEFAILQTTYNPNIGTVLVEQRYDQGNFTEIKRFTYNLERRDAIWFIVNYNVLNLGTE